MEKDFIKIDELFKDLKYGEEPSSAGSWLRMKELLEEQMSGAVRLRRGLARYLIPALLVLLAGGAAIYYAARPGAGEKDGFDGLLSTGQAVIARHDPVKQSPAANGIAMDSSNQKPPEDRTPDTREAEAIASTENAPPDKMPSSLIPELRHKQHASRQTTVIGQPVRNHSGFTPGRKIPPVELATIQRLMHPETIGLPAPQPYPKRPLPTRDGSSTTTPPVIETEKVIGRFDPNTGKRLDGAQAGPAWTHAAGAAATEPGFKQVSLPDGRHVFQDKNGDYYNKQKDTISRYMVTQTPVVDRRTRTLKKIRIDTVAVLQLERVQYTPVSAGLMAFQATPATVVMPTTGNKSVVPAAAVNGSNAKSANHLVPLDNFKVKSRKLGPNAFEKLQNTTNGLASVFDGSTNWYAALIVGGNASFGNPAAFGLQAGIAVFYSFAERWAISGGVNFMNKYFPGYSFADRSSDYDVNRTKIPGGGWKYSGKSVTTTHSYTVNSLNTLNVPFYLNYNLTDRLSLFGGPNLSYTLPVKWEKENKIQYQNIETTREDGTNPFVNTSFQIDEQEDFASRFGLGYVGGLSYDISRTMSLDTRIQQTLWYNNDSRLESLNSLFKKPSFELSFSYYFGRKERVIYILDAHARRR